VKRQSETKDLEMLEQARRKFDDVRTLAEKKSAGNGQAAKGESRPQQQQRQLFMIARAHSL
jgi:hypothetical protein